MSCDFGIYQTVAALHVSLAGLHRPQNAEKLLFGHGGEKQQTKIRFFSDLLEDPVLSEIFFPQSSSLQRWHLGNKKI